MTKRQQSKRWRAIRKGKPAAPRGPSYDPETPVAGWYEIRLRKGGPPVAVEIWHGPPVNPETGEIVPERGERWQCRVNGQLVPVEDMWPGCARVRIDQAEHDRIVSASRTMDRANPFYDPFKPINRLTAPVPF